MIPCNWKFIGAKSQNVTFLALLRVFSEGQFTVNWRIYALDGGTKGGSQGDVLGKHQEAVCLLFCGQDQLHHYACVFRRPRSRETMMPSGYAQ